MRHLHVWLVEHFPKPQRDQFQVRGERLEYRRRQYREQTILLRAMNWRHDRDPAQRAQGSPGVEWPERYRAPGEDRYLQNMAFLLP